MSILNLGDVTFGLTAQTDGMKRAQDVLNQFGRQVAAAAKSQSAGAQTVARAYNAQEKAARAAFQQTTALQAQIRKAGGDTSQLTAATRAFSALNREMTRGKLTVTEFTRAQDRFKIQLDRVRQAAAGSAFDTSGATRFSKVLRDLQSSAILTFGPLSGVGTRISVLSALMNRSTTATVAMVAGIATVGTAFYMLSSNAIRADMAMQKINASLMVATGNTTAARAEFQFISKVADTLGMNLQASAVGYAQLAVAAKGTSLEGQQTRDIFVAVSEASRALNLDAADTEGVFRALAQMMSKGTVQAEELRGQLGDRVVGAFQSAARAMGKSTQELDKMMKAGTLITSEFLPKLAAEWHDAFGASAVQMAEGTQASIERLKNSVFRFGIAFNEATGVSLLFKETLDLLANAINAVSEALEWASNAVKGFISSQQDATNEIGKFVGQQKEGLTASKSVIKTNLEQAKSNLVLAESEYAKLQAKKTSDSLWDKFSFEAKAQQKGPGWLDQDMADVKADIMTNQAYIKSLQDMLDRAKEGTGVTGGDGNLKEKQVRKALDMMDELERRTAALKKGPKAMEDFAKWKEQTDQIDAYRNALESAGYAQDIINAKVSEFSIRVGEQAKAQEQYEKVTKKLADAASQWFDSTADDLMRLRDKTIEVSEFFDNMINNVLNSLQKLVIEQTITNPLMDVLGSVLGSIGGSFFGGSSGGLTADEMSAKPPGRAWGGNMTGNSPYEVFDAQGSRKDQMELFVPRSSGNMVSGIDSLGGDVEIIINNNVGADVKAKTTKSGGKTQTTIDFNQMIASEIGKPGSPAQRAASMAGRQGNTSR